MVHMLIYGIVHYNLNSKLSTSTLINYSQHEPEYMFNLITVRINAPFRLSLPLASLESNDLTFKNVMVSKNRVGQQF